MEVLKAETILEHDGIVAAMARMQADHTDYEVEPDEPGGWTMRSVYGSVSAVVAGKSARIRVAAPDETCLSYMKMSVAEHMEEYLGEAPQLRWSGDGIERGIPVFFREVTVLSSARVAPFMQRVRFSCPNLQRFTHGGFHMRLLLPPAGRKPVWPTIAPNGAMAWPGGQDAHTVRVYTIREIDATAGWFEVDFVLHDGDDTPAATFAEQARPGDVIGMIGPGGGGVPESANLLLLGDDTAVPAISRIVAEMPSGTKARVIVEVDGPADAEALALPAGAEVTWLYREGAEPGTTRLLPEALDALDPATLPADLFVWAGCEFSAFREIRATLRKKWGLKKERHLAVAYWRRGVGGETPSDEH